MNKLKLFTFSILLTSLSIVSISNAQTVNASNTSEYPKICKTDAINYHATSPDGFASKCRCPLNTKETVLPNNGALGAVKYTCQAKSYCSVDTWLSYPISLKGMSDKCSCPSDTFEIKMINFDGSIGNQKFLCTKGNSL